MMQRFKVGDELIFSGEGKENTKWWKVEAADDNFAIATRYSVRWPSKYYYTIVDYKNDVRGPCNLIGQGWSRDYGEDVDWSDEFNRRDRSYRLEGYERLLRAMNIGAGYAKAESFRLPDDPSDWIWEEEYVEISHRNNIELKVLDARV